jgi:Sulfotransferase family
MERGPIFLGGIDRSGKTLMRLMLTSHPNIAMTRRPNLWSHFYGRYGDLGVAENFERCLAALLSYKHVAHLQPDAERLRREFWAGEPTYARLFALLLRQHAERAGKARWGDQTGLVERYAAPIFAAYPGARLIHMVRDPRDRYATARHASERVGRSTAMWLYSVGLAARNRLRYPSQVKLVRYEDLVQRPEVTLREICAFLDEPYAPAMLTMAGESGRPEPKGPLSATYIGRYRGVVPARELTFIQLHAGHAMADLGYRRDPLRLAPGEAVRFALADWPVNVARMLAWRTREAMQHQRAALGGRRRGPSRIGARGGATSAD